MPGRTTNRELSPDRKKRPRLTAAEIRQRKVEQRRALRVASMRITGDLPDDFPQVLPPPPLPTRLDRPADARGGKPPAKQQDAPTPPEESEAEGMYRILKKVDEENTAPPPTYTLPRKSHRKLDAARQEQVLKLICEGTPVRTAAAKVGVSYDQMISLTKDDEEFGSRYQEAKELGAFFYLELTRKRAVEGWVEPVFGKDGLVGFKRVFDNSLLKDLNRSHMPTLFGPTVQVNHDHNHRGGVLVIHEPAGGLTTEQQLAALDESQRKGIAAMERQITIEHAAQPPKKRT